MKTIPLISITEKHKENDVDISTVELIRICVNSIPQGGITAGDMANRLRILSKLENVNGELELEDSDFKNLSEYVRATKWNIVSHTIAEFNKLFE